MPMPIILEEEAIREFFRHRLTMENKLKKTVSNSEALLTLLDVKKNDKDEIEKLRKNFLKQSFKMLSRKEYDRNIAILDQLRKSDFLRLQNL